MVESARRVARAQRDLTVGSLKRLIWQLSAPSAVEMALFNVVSLLDVYWLGRLGGTALAAATMGLTLRLVLISPMMGLSVGGMAVVARHLGARDQERADHAVMQTILLMLSIVLPLAAIGLAFGPTFLRWMGAEGALLDEASAYVQVIFVGLLFMEMLPTINGVIRGAGHPEYTLRTNIANVAVMMVAEPVLVFGLGPAPALGVAGAAWAAVLGSAAGVAAQVVILLRGSAGVTIRLADAKPDLATMGRVLKVALPTAAQRFSPNTGNAILIRLVAGLGTEVLTAYSVVSRIFGFLQCPSMGIANAVGPLVGQNLGGRQTERAERAAVYSAWASFGCSLVVYSLLNVVPGPVLGLFTREAGVVAVATGAVRFTIVTAVAGGWLLVLGSALAGAGDAISPMLANMGSLWLVQLPACWALSSWLRLGATGIWAGFCLGHLVGAVAITLQFRRGRWKTLAL